ncbi:autophagy-related protein 17 [[Candida] railenensis]|uniref:Autophagy-related protein 17 n=1 Tax=[Candida] railenensis TaxID=45579 RepID=A0A9P0QPU3_9ASCO|nr:autophagy-related protein 17 [[Candida] railenensis]
MPTIDELNNWIYDAQKTLVSAQRICSEAEQKLKVNDSDITHKLPRKISYISNIFSTIKELQRRCTFIVDKCSTMQQKGLEKVDTTSLETLMMIISQLRATKVPEFVVASGGTHHSGGVGGAGVGGGGKKGFNLSDFISIESIDVLKQNVEGYDSNFKKINQLLADQHAHLIKAPFGSISKKYTKLLKTYNDIMYEVNASNNNSNILRQILKENSSLEGELATILEQLTNHYDQVFRLREESIKDANATAGDFSVLENDVLELPEVSNELQNIYDIIVHNSNRASELCSNRFHLLSTIEFELEKQVESYKEFKDVNIIKFVTLYSKCASQLEAVETAQAQMDLATVDQLIFHYRKFLTVYKHNFYSELHYEKYVYPRKFLNKLKKFLNEELDQISKHERERRKNWLEKYGDFIPKEFHLPGESEQPSIVQVITEGLDEIGGDEDAEIERKILDLISTGNISKERSLAGEV